MILFNYNLRFFKSNNNSFIFSIIFFFELIIIVFIFLQDLKYEHNEFIKF
jgi:hypothetical protein